MIGLPAALEFREPALGLLLLLVPVVYVLARRAPGLLSFSSLALVPAHGRGWRARLAFLPDLLLALAFAALVAAAMGPRIGEQFSRIQREGIAIMMVVDRSSSMEALDLDPERTRLAVVQDVFEEFVLGGGGLRGRPDDAIGLVSFAGFADTAAPLTLDHENLTAAARNLDIARVRGEDGTAIGDALGLAVERLRESPARSRIALLLTDGVSNAGVETPAAAAELARTQGVKVYTVGAGSEGLAPIRVRDPFTGRSVLRQMPVDVDEATLADIAERTGGHYYRATDADALAEVYAAIDALERTRLVEDRTRQYDEYFALPLALALALSALAWLLRGAVFARTP